MGTRKILTVIHKTISIVQRFTRVPKLQYTHQENNGRKLLFPVRIAANQKNTGELVEHFSKYIQFLTDHSHLQDGFAELKAKSDFRPETLSINEKLSNFTIIVNEDIIPIYQTFANNQNIQ